MKRKILGVFAAALMSAGAATLATPAAAGGYGRGECNCYGPVTQVVNAGTRVYTTRRVVTTNRVIPHIHVVNHNRVILHRRTIVHRVIVVHRHNTVEDNITVNRINTAHRFQTVHRRQVVVHNVYTHSRRHESRTVRGRDCNCGPGEAGYHGRWRSSYGHRYAIRSRY